MHDRYGRCGNDTDRKFLNDITCLEFNPYKATSMFRVRYSTIMAVTDNVVNFDSYSVTLIKKTSP